MIAYLDTLATLDTLIERLDEGDMTSVSIGHRHVHLSLADVDALARVADLIDAEPYLLPRDGTPLSLHIDGSWRGQVLSAATSFVKRAAA